ncbi:uncharacterized protein TRAVEDRAFT_111365 [Trametes versicolor FP-101664 SS1]|uniref:uncharacterized protein n=1 Tax=Trametes versicolor (strain FP-101664) TaxID=717944 RepID=UPI0004621E51|nr:uncharacterized protein TRAVEDRAFT_111365 [Trametes versicolor FP-101664 SS1]EIW64190.1 hypothetical protein TRAVEDRAFT_111365 [Trametes versicolor FP-101664 SS1]
MSRTPHRSSSRTYRWVEDQQHVSGARPETAPPSSMRANPYLAYPHLSATSLVKDNKGTIRTVESYVFVDDDAPHAPRGRDAGATTQPASRAETPSAPSTPRKSFRSSQGLFHSASPLRSLHLTFSARRPSAPAPAATSSVERSLSPASSTSTFRRTAATAAAAHSRGSSLSTVNAMHQRSARAASPELSASPPKTTAWKFKRPSVAGHFSPAPEDEQEGSPPPRPSTSSSFTHSGSSTVYTRTSSDAPRKMHFGSIRSHSSTTIFSASPSLWSLPTDASHINDPPESEKVIARDRLQSSSEGASVAWKPSSTAVPHLGNVTNILTSPRSRKKRKLIISGIPPDDERRFEGVRKWCESFGELNSITRAPNGDLHIDFRKVEVADTVCRLNARVYIAGVGSVCLSWFTGKRP